MATKYYDEDSQLYRFPFPFSQQTAKNQALNHALEVLRTYGLDENAIVYGWEARDTEKINSYRGKKGEPKAVGIITKCVLSVGINTIQAQIRRAYES